MAEEKSSLEIGIEQMSRAIFDGDYSQVVVHDVTIIPPMQFSPADITTLRSELNLTQWRLATVMNVSLRTVRNWESGRSHPSRVANRLLEAIKKEPSIVEHLWGMKSERVYK
ncbi:helix-turn-helix domain-containing protein [Lactiplantibacillus plajomi]|uniref:Helix-turn-helix domain-containing protein n=1 Tax=Lactiplantibacillus plajomi TaxID=1457217 RepID=A0ABV6K2F3_9LACO|nr:helix-turn-helix domain-containing protein [Lactiplantibacillus plajomi]